MSKSLPDRPSLEHLRNEAKALLRTHRQGDRSAYETLRHVARLQGSSDDEVLAAKISLQEAQHALARLYGFESWAQLKRHVETAALLRNESVKVRMRALRDCAIGMHPDWNNKVGFGWGLACKARSVPGGVRALIGLLQDDNWRIRREAVCTLAAYADLGDGRVNEALRKALGDRRHAVQHAAARAGAVRCPGCGQTPELSEYVRE